MQFVLEKEYEKLRSLEAFQEMLSTIPSNQTDGFLDTLHAHYSRYLQENPSTAFSRALAYALSRSFIESDEFEQKADLQPHVCPITGSLVESQPVYFADQVDSQGVPHQVYHRSDIIRWIREKGSKQLIIL